MTASDQSRFQPGDHALLRFVHDDLAYFIVPITIVQDDPDVTMYYAAAGSPIRKRVYPDGTSIPRDLAYTERVKLPVTIGHGTWHPYHTLSIVPSGAAYEIRYQWHVDDWSFRGWYVNLQAPLVRDDQGVRTNDLLLDLTVDPDGTWHWKDEDEFADAVAVGVYSPEQAAAIRAAGAAVIPEIEARRGPFDGALIDWRPDPAWTLPAIPETWKELAR